MINIEEDVFDYIANSLEKEFSEVTVGDETRTPASFPFVSVVEADNYAYEKTKDSGSLENHAVLMYEVNVYSNKTVGKKRECKDIFSYIDELFQKIGFVRTGESTISINDATGYRLVGRYKAVASKEKIIYGG